MDLCIKHFFHVWLKPYLLTLSDGCKPGHLLKKSFSGKPLGLRKFPTSCDGLALPVKPVWPLGSGSGSSSSMRQRLVKSLQIWGLRHRNIKSLLWKWHLKSLTNCNPHVHHFVHLLQIQFTAIDLRQLLLRRAALHGCGLWMSGRQWPA